MTVNDNTAAAWRACQEIGKLLTVTEHYVHRGERLDALERITMARAALGRASLALADLHEQQEQQAHPSGPPSWMMHVATAPKPAREHVAVDHG